MLRYFHLHIPGIVLQKTVAIFCISRHSNYVYHCNAKNFQLIFYNEYIFTFQKYIMLCNVIHNHTNTFIQQGIDQFLCNFVISIIRHKNLEKKVLKVDT